MNDFKRMWTKEEIKNAGGLNVVQATEIIGYDNNVNDYPVFNVNDKAFTNKTNLVVVNIRGGSEVYYLRYNGSLGWVGFGLSGMLSYQYTYRNYGGGYYPTLNKNVTGYEFEQLVKATPTSVSIIEDQGKLELMLEHDGEVLEVNDTPNQFLQRRLDKPSAEWNSETSETDLGSWLQEKWSSMHVGQILYFYEDGHDIKGFFIITDITSAVDVNTLGVINTPNGIIINGSIKINMGVILGTLNGNYTISFNDISIFRLF